MDTFDASALLARLEGDVVAFQEIKRLFFQSVRLQIDSVCQAIQTREVAQIAIGAHTIKGACANFGANSMEDMALKMELATKNGDLETASDLIVRLQAELERIQRLVEERQNE